MAYNLLSLDNVLAYTRGFENQFQDDGMDEWRLDMIRYIYNVKCKNNETFIPHECFFDICSPTVSLPFATKDIIYSNVFETDKTTTFGTNYMYRTDYDKFYAGQPARAFDMYGNQIKYKTNDVVGKLQWCQFKAMTRDEAGELVIVEDYAMPIARMVAAEKMSLEAIPAKTGASDRLMERAKSEIRTFNGRANSSNPMESNYAANLTLGMDKRFIRTNWW